MTSNFLSPSVFLLYRQKLIADNKISSRSTLAGSTARHDSDIVYVVPSCHFRENLPSGLSHLASRHPARLADQP